MYDMIRTEKCILRYPLSPEAKALGFEMIITHTSTTWLSLPPMTITTNGTSQWHLRLRLSCTIHALVNLITVASQDVSHGST
jgi:hypothetical protein